MKHKIANYNLMLEKFYRYLVDIKTNEFKETEIRETIKNYLSARKHFLEVARKYPAELKGNDNIIGRIGEYLAMKYLRHKKLVPKKVESNSQQGYDIICDGKRKFSVKIITMENAIGRTVRLTEPWDEFILIELDEDYSIKRLGHLTKDSFNKALIENPTWSKNPYAKKTMLGDKGIIGRYGYVEKDFENFTQ